MDVKLAGGNWQCDWGDGTCQEMEDEFDYADTDPAERSNDFKYVFDVSLCSCCWSEADSVRPTEMPGARGFRDSWPVTSELGLGLKVCVLTVSKCCHQGHGIPRME